MRICFLAVATVLPRKELYSIVLTTEAALVLLLRLAIVPAIEDVMRTHLSVSQMVSCIIG